MNGHNKTGLNICNKEQFADRLRQLRKEKGYTQEEFATEMNRLNSCSLSSVKKWENPYDEDYFPSFNKIVSICNVLDCTPNQLLDFTQPTNIEIASECTGLNTKSIQTLKKLSETQDKLTPPDIFPDNTNQNITPHSRSENSLSHKMDFLLENHFLNLVELLRIIDCPNETKFIKFTMEIYNSAIKRKSGKAKYNSIYDFVSHFTKDYIKQLEHDVIYYQDKYDSD